MKINSDFYKGFEGENEIRFIKVCTNETEVLSIWDGYFNDIMEQFKPSEGGWEGLSYYYHLNTGWYDASPWEIPDPQNALEQFQNVGKASLRFERSQDVLNAICNFISNAITIETKVYISEE